MDNSLEWCKKRMKKIANELGMSEDDIKTIEDMFTETKKD